MDAQGQHEARWVLGPDLKEPRCPLSRQRPGPGRAHHVVRGPFQRQLIQGPLEEPHLCADHRTRPQHPFLRAERVPVGSRDLDRSLHEPHAHGSRAGKEPEQAGLARFPHGVYAHGAGRVRQRLQKGLQGEGKLHGLEVRLAAQFDVRKKRPPVLQVELPDPALRHLDLHVVSRPRRFPKEGRRHRPGPPLEGRQATVATAEAASPGQGVPFQEQRERSSLRGLHLEARLPSALADFRLQQVPEAVLVVAGQTAVPPEEDPGLVLARRLEDLDLQRRHDKQCTAQAASGAAVPGQHQMAPGGPFQVSPSPHRGPQAASALPGPHLKAGQATGQVVRLEDREAGQFLDVEVGRERPPCGGSGDGPGPLLGVEEGRRARQRQEAPSVPRLPVQGPSPGKQHPLRVMPGARLPEGDRSRPVPARRLLRRSPGKVPVLAAHLEGLVRVHQEAAGGLRRLRKRLRPPSFHRLRLGGIAPPQNEGQALRVLKAAQEHGGRGRLGPIRQLACQKIRFDLLQEARTLARIAEPPGQFGLVMGRRPAGAAQRLIALRKPMNAPLLAQQTPERHQGLAGATRQTQERQDMDQPFRTRGVPGQIESLGDVPHRAADIRGREGDHAAKARPHADVAGLPEAVFVGGGEQGRERRCCTVHVPDRTRV
ncbi:MAG: hypothetical protein BWY56_02444 [Acidobacteria bacterium ADurb.Bin340]|nr:MAG: hypothetical protein BWY56_02444 [Acidobacteria bacterium ADurb.Bin340]